MPRASAQVVRSSVLELRVERKKKSRRRWVAMLVVLVALVWGMNHFMIGAPVAAALAADERTAGIGFGAHLRYWVDPTTLTLDLRRAQVADTTDLFRGLLAAALAVGEGSWGIPDAVVLSRNGDPVYTVAGSGLRQMAHDFPLARRPAVVLAALVQALRRPDGAPLAPDLTVEDAARGWATGHP